MIHYLLMAATAATGLVFLFQVHLYLRYIRQVEELDAYESRAIDLWRSPLLPLIYAQRNRLNQALAQQRVILVVSLICFLVALYTLAK